MLKPKRNTRVFILSFVLGTFASLLVQAQINSENGYNIPLKGTVRVFIIFAEITDDCPGETKNYTPDPSKWAPGQLPVDKDNYVNVNSPTEPGGKITDLLYESSFRQYVLLGDYYYQMVSLTCADVTTYGKLGAIERFLNNDPNFRTAHNIPLQSFAQWNVPTVKGVLKTPALTDKFLECVAVIWRNVEANGRLDCGNDAYISLNAQSTSFQIQGMSGTDNMFEGSACYDDGWMIPFLVEFTHAMFGRNKFHGTAGGSGARTFIPDYGHWYSILMQAGPGPIMAMYNAWDRDRTGWKEPSKIFLISALNGTGASEVPTAFDISNQSSTSDGIYILRDFATSGDAIRIKLPYLNAPPNTAVYNQYIWLENHQKKSPFDTDFFTNTCRENLSPGMYAYITVGKDVKTRTESEVFENAPMDLEGWFYPLTAEGNYDFFYDYNNIITGADADVDCNFGNDNIPINKSLSLLNPFTGHNDLYQFLDYNKDGEWPTGDQINGSRAIVGSSEIINGNIVKSWQQSGDKDDAYNSNISGNLKLSLSANPAPIPIYTFRTFILPDPTPSPEDNRKIWLNGLSIEILQENVLGNGEIKVKVQWDNYNIDKDVRWCGDIMLSDFPPAGNNSGALDFLDVKSGVTLLLDQGLSATRTADPIIFKGQKVLADPTVFTCLPGSHFHMEPNSTVIIDNGSTVRMQANSLFEIHEGAQLIIRNGSKFIIDEAGAVCHMHKESAIIVESGGEFIINHGKLEGHSEGSTEVSQFFVKAGGKLTLGTGVNQGGDTQINLAQESHIVIEDGGTMVMNGNDIVLQDNDTDIHISGNISTADNVDLTFQGDGFLKFFKTHTLTLGDNSNLNLTGTDKTDLVLSLEDEGCEINLQQHDLLLTNGRVRYAKDARIKVSGSSPLVILPPRGNVRVTDVSLHTIDGTRVGNATGIDAFSVPDFSMNNCSVNGFFTGVRIEGSVIIDPGTGDVFRLNQANMSGCGFGGCETDVEVLNMNRMQFTNCTFALRGILSSFDIGMSASSTDIVIADNILIQKENIDIGGSPKGFHGIELTDVIAYEQYGGSVGYCIVGIHGIRSNLFLRNQAAVEQNDIGVSLPVPPHTTQSSSLTMGDQGCGWIISNGTGVQGTNILLNIDADLHAPNNGGRKPNRFDGNGRVFDICWNDGTNNILMRGNYWGSNTLTGPGVSLQALGNYILKTNPGCNTNLSFDDSRFRLNKPIDCSDLGVVGQGGTGVAEACAIKGSDGLSIGEASIEAHAQFFIRAFKDARDRFDRISGEDNKPPVMVNPPCRQTVKVAGVMRKVSEVHARADSIAQANASGGSRMGHFEDETENLQQEKFEYKIQNHPNPFSDKTTFSYGAADDGKVSLEIYTITGQLVTKLLNETPVQKGNYQLDWNTEKIPAGVYFYRYVTPEKVFNQKMVVVK